MYSHGFWPTTWIFPKNIFAKPKPLGVSTPGTNVDFPLELAQELGLDIEKFINDANDPSIDAQIQKEIEQMKNAGIPRMSVPKFLVAGREPQGRDINAWSAIIDAELKKNKK